MNPIIVTGASGLVGGALLDRFRREGPVIGTGLLHAGESLRAVDLRDRVAVQRLVQEVNPSAVIHAAACPDPDRCEADPVETSRLNVEATRWLLDALPAGVPFVLISTDYVFDGTRAPYREDDPVGPVNVYGQSKVEAESWTRRRPGALVVRIPLQVGPVPASGRPGFIAQLRAQIESASPTEVDDVLIRVPTWSPDVADAIAHLLRLKASGTYHISAPEAATRWGWTQRLAVLLGKPIDHLRPSKTVVPRKARRPVDGHLRTDKLQASGWSSYTNFDAMVAELVRTR